MGKVERAGYGIAVTGVDRRDSAFDDRERLLGNGPIDIHPMNPT